MGAFLGADPDDLAFVTNATSGVNAVLRSRSFTADDELLTSDHAYNACRNALTYVGQRTGAHVVIVPVSFPATSDAVIEAVLARVTPRTKLALLDHVTSPTALVLPIERLIPELSRRGIDVLVDGAHAFAHFPFKRDDLECDYYGCSLHKWLLAPVGTGFLYVRRENIAKLWPLTPAAASKSDNIRKFEEVGTHPAANHNAIAEALVFHQAIGSERKAARLRYLTDRWAKQVDSLPRVKILSSREPNQAWGLANVNLEGVDVSKATFPNMSVCAKPSARGPSPRR